MIVISDVDKTLIDVGATEGSACRRLFAALREQGVPFGFATSRPIESVERALPFSTGLASFLVCSDGGVIVERDPRGQWQVIHRQTLSSPLELLPMILDCAPSTSSLFVFGDDRTQYSVAVRTTSDHERAAAEILGSRTRMALEDVQDKEAGVLSIAILDDQANCRRACEDIERSPAMTLEPLTIRVYDEVRVERNPMLWWCDVMSVTTDKGTACKWLLEQEEFATARRDGGLIVLADGDNDAQLVEQADIAYCPPWASHLLQGKGKVVNDVVDCEEFLTVIGPEILQRGGAAWG